MSGYRDFSEFYDRLMVDMDYGAYAAYLLVLFERHGSRPKTVLDIACGSGNLGERLQAEGIDVIGLDSSADMLARAAEKMPNALLLCQDMRTMDLYGTADAAVCTLDSLNHLNGTADIAKVLARTRLFLEPHGLFIFDVNTPYKHKEVLGDNTFVWEEDGVFCTWCSAYSPRNHRVDMLLDFFEETEDGLYERTREQVTERAYTERTWRRLLAEAGFETLAVYDSTTDAAPKADCERWVFVARSTRTEQEARGIQ